MNCPRCGSTMRTIGYEGAQVETCPGCKGEWLDGGELKQIVQTVEETFSAEEIASLDAIHKSIFTIDESPENELKCPKCQDAELNRFTYACTTGITLDKCSQCGGIWLDSAELEKVQILVEEWKKKLAEDQEKYGGILIALQAESDAAEERQLDHSNLPHVGGFVNCVLRYLVD